MALADLLRAIVRHRKPQGVHITIVTPSTQVDGRELARALEHQRRRNGRL